jgi:hypothetical protein
MFAGSARLPTIWRIEQKNGRLYCPQLHGGSVPSPRIGVNAFAPLHLDNILAMTSLNGRDLNQATKHGSVEADGALMGEDHVT